MLDESTVNLRIHPMHLILMRPRTLPYSRTLCSSCRVVSSFFHFGMVLMI